jgi:hypothetical protein
MSGIGPTQPTWAVQQVGSYLGYTGRGAGVVAKAAFDPEPTLAVCRITSIKGTTLGARHRCCITLP